MSKAIETSNNLLKIDDRHVVPAGKHYCLTAWSGQPRLRTRRLRAPTRVELHLNSDPLKSYAKQIKTAGGTYSDVRGGRLTRYVDLPLTASALANTLIKTYGNGQCTVILRGGHSASGGSGHVVKAATVEDALRVHTTCLRAEVEAGKTRLVTEADLIADDERYEREKHNHGCNRLRSGLTETLELIQTTGIDLSTDERAVLDALANRAVAAKKAE